MESPLRRGAGTPGLKLIETLGWDGRAFPRLDRHLDRLAQSAQRLGWTCDAALARAALEAAVSPEPLRVRLTLDAKGVLEVGCTPLPPTPSLWRIGLAAVALQSSDPWLTLKSSHRAIYDDARAALPAGLDEVIFQNENGEVCDGTITSVFFDAGDGMCTPPLRCGLLPGVLRAELLATGKLREAVLMAQDLPRVRLWVGNSLRGLIPARWG